MNGWFKPLESGVDQILEGGCAAKVLTPNPRSPSRAWSEVAPFLRGQLTVLTFHVLYQVLIPLVGSIYR
jgi:hypothetical protein